MRAANNLFSAGCCNEKELALFHFAFLSFSKHWELQWVPPLADGYLRNLVLPKDRNGTCPNLSDCLKLSFTDVKEKYRMFRCGTPGVCVLLITEMKLTCEAGYEGFFCTIFICFSSDTASIKARYKFILGAALKISYVWFIEFVT